jgi:hypothetical protein
MLNGKRPVRRASEIARLAGAGEAVLVVDVLLAKSIQNKRQCQDEDSAKLEGENKSPVYERPTIVGLERVPNASVNVRVQRPSPQLDHMMKRDVFGRIVLRDGARFLDWSGIEIGGAETHRIWRDIDRTAKCG